MPDNNNKTKVLYLDKNNIFLLMYDVKMTISNEFFNPSLCNISNFRPKTKIAIKLQIYSCNFKIKRKEKNIRYFSKFIIPYKL